MTTLFDLRFRGRLLLALAYAHETRAFHLWFGADRHWALAWGQP